jgi:hypothetical protein
VLIHRGRPNPVGAEYAARHRHAGKSALPALLRKS